MITVDSCSKSSLKQVYPIVIPDVKLPWFIYALSVFFQLNDFITGLCDQIINLLCLAL